ncbi:hypothetical protein J9345_18900 [Bacillus subtilis subsp. subtilis]|uniref:hypothetical protein n=1 Tax=Bacillus subtilis TaxID=1423 RepID=UPI00155A410B|nr:hypothetical protein [Bacillus subtilis]MBP3048622.1 hypothetical protein [Bacillus subtilis subsp. subtilis]MEC1265330.1 hypothetical protein [Bacillus subtilis]MEC3695463.1 hypothetical protein [Bacillus subtilis]NLS88023.1 hypothetical protein [Bacillus subtilis]QRQ53652.1 hypothetical protein JR441_06525 [Bacillus subtilis]
MEENKPKEMDLETKVELFERKAAGYRQNWMNAEDIIMTYQYMIEKDKQVLAEKDQEIQHLKEHIEKLEKNLNNLKGPVKLNHQKK